MFTLEWHISLFSSFLCIDYVYVLLCVVVYAAWQIWGCLMNICIAKCNKNWRSWESIGDLAEWIFLLCVSMILAKGQSYYHHCIMKKMNFDKTCKYHTQNGYLGICSVLRCNMYTIIMCIGCLYHINAILYIRFISDVLLWTTAYGQAKAERPARTYIQWGYGM